MHLLQFEPTAAKPKKAIYSGQKLVNKKPELSSVLTNVVSDNVNDKNIAMVGGILALEQREPITPIATQITESRTQV